MFRKRTLATIPRHLRPTFHSAPFSPWVRHTKHSSNHNTTSSPPAQQANVEEDTLHEVSKLCNEIHQSIEQQASVEEDASHEISKLCNEINHSIEQWLELVKGPEPHYNSPKPSFHPQNLSSESLLLSRYNAISSPPHKIPELQDLLLHDLLLESEWGGSMDASPIQPPLHAKERHSSLLLFQLSISDFKERDKSVNGFATRQDPLHFSDPWPEDLDDGQSSTSIQSLRTTNEMRSFMHSRADLRLSHLRRHQGVSATLSGLEEQAPSPPTDEDGPRPWVPPAFLGPPRILPKWQQYLRTTRGSGWQLGLSQAQREQLKRERVKTARWLQPMLKSYGDNWPLAASLGARAFVLAHAKERRGGKPDSFGWNWLRAVSVWEEAQPIDGHELLCLGFPGFPGHPPDKSEWSARYRKFEWKELEDSWATGVLERARQPLVSSDHLATLDPAFPFKKMELKRSDIYGSFYLWLYDLADAHGEDLHRAVVERAQAFDKESEEGVAAWLQLVLPELQEAYGEDWKAGVAEVVEREGSDRGVKGNRPTYRKFDSNKFHERWRTKTSEAYRPGAIDVAEEAGCTKEVVVELDSDF